VAERTEYQASTGFVGVQVGLVLVLEGSGHRAGFSGAPLKAVGCPAGVAVGTG